jgi:hypothetical protein
MLNNCVETRGFWAMPDMNEHNIFKELKEARYAIHALLSKLKAKTDAAP